MIVNPKLHDRDAADALGLKRVPPEGSTEDSFSIWDGSQFVFQSSPWKLITLWRLIHRYWLMYFQFHTPKDMLHKFLRLYDLQKKGQSFETPAAFLEELDLYNLTQTSMRAYITVRPLLCFAYPLLFLPVPKAVAVMASGLSACLEMTFESPEFHKHCVSVRLRCIVQYCFFVRNVGLHYWQGTIGMAYYWSVCELVRRHTLD